MMQVVVLNKVDLPDVAAKQAELEAALREAIPHTRFMTISAREKINTSELMQRVGH
jgi:GTPase Era involved in 16S rRNA processing